MIDFTNIYELEVKLYTYTVYMYTVYISPLVNGLVLLIIFCMWPLREKSLDTPAVAERKKSFS